MPSTSSVHEKQPLLSGSAESRVLLRESQGRAYGSSSRSGRIDAYYDEDLVYSKEEEEEVVGIIDRRLFPFILMTTFVLNMDRTNISNAISDNLAQDLGFGMSTLNNAHALYAFLFAIFCMTGAIAAKIAGPSRCKEQQFFLMSNKH